MEDWSKTRASDVMTSLVVTVPREARLAEVVKLLAEHAIRGVPVVNHLGEPVGVITQHDVLAFLAGLETAPAKLSSFYFQSYLRWEHSDLPLEDLDSDLLQDTPVDDVMTPQVVTVRPETPLPQVVHVLCSQQIHRVLVHDGQALVGVISSFDVLRSLPQEAPPE